MLSALCKKVGKSLLASVQCFEYATHQIDSEQHEQDNRKNSHDHKCNQGTENLL